MPCRAFFHASTCDSNWTCLSINHDPSSSALPSKIPLTSASEMFRLFGLVIQAPVHPIVKLTFLKRLFFWRLHWLSTDLGVGISFLSLSPASSQACSFIFLGLHFFFRELGVVTLEIMVKTWKNAHFFCLSTMWECSKVQQMACWRANVMCLLTSFFPSAFPSPFIYV